MIDLKLTKITPEDFYIESSYDSRYDDIINDMVNKMAREIDEQLVSQIMSSSFMSVEDRATWIVKHGMEKEFGMTFEEFKQAYEKLVRDNPEKLI